MASRNIAKSKTTSPNFIPGTTFFFISEDVGNTDKDLFFGPLDGTEQWIIVQHGWTMANIAVEAGIFPSLSQARKNGMGDSIPLGWSTLAKGKAKNRKEIFILHKPES